MTAVSVDVIVLRLARRGLQVLTIERWAEPFAGRLALPGVLLADGETLADAAVRALADKADLAPGSVGAIRQVRAFDEANRDPRGRTLAVAHHVRIDAEATVSGTWLDAGAPLDLPFDHGLMISTVVASLGARHPDALTTLLGPSFTSGDFATAVRVGGGEVDPSNLTRTIPSVLPAATRTGENAVTISTGRSSAVWQLAVGRHAVWQLP
ncbi:NUDIX hydrolase [Micrococcales bacterium 31B]|nr:NUDIX hydrolase [Micrococcales bacterium 31B]